MPVALTAAQTRFLRGQAHDLKALLQIGNKGITPAFIAELDAVLDGAAVDLVLSDMAPNKSGVDAVDQPRMMHLAELAMEFADGHLKPGGAFLIKLFQGTGFDDYIRELRRRYDKVAIRKPDASRKRSPEVYALGQGKRTQIK